jgi:uncharacterized membrane protein
MKNKSRANSLVKSILWRVMGYIVKFIITYIFVKFFNYPEPGKTALIISTVHHATFIIVFYLHERFWNSIKKDLGRLRTIIKAFIYEVILGMGIGTLIVFIFTKNWTLASTSTIVYTIVKLIMYYLYDRLWDNGKL